MPDLVLVDTDILIDAGRAVNDAVSCLRQIEQQASLAISAVAQMELIIGCRSKAELRALDRFLLRFQVIKLTEHISDGAIDLLQRYRLSHGLLIADALIAATALSLDMSFVTKNQSDYRFIAGLHLLAYPQPFATQP
ncbi:MAG TPA: type II toxin-antitoxin system VapC family toxin [Anaerolineae bacterium]|nr:type II toxin-antitoxin system VapC family toxin [Anaerolineae bacterium]